MDHRPIRSVGVIGSGLAGLTAAIRLKERGLHCTLFEKDRGPGGRLSSARTDDASLDLGAQFFTVRDASFRTFLDQYAGAASYGIWEADLRFENADGSLVDMRPAERYVGVPQMSALTRRLSQSLGENANQDSSLGSALLHYDHCIVRASYDSKGWYLWSHTNLCLGPFDALIVTAPPAQAAVILAEYPAVSAKVASYTLEPCWAVGCRYDKPIGVGFDAAMCKHSILGWVARDSSKPQRRHDQEWWVLHAQAGWSWLHRDDDSGAVIKAVITAFQERFGVIDRPVATLAHRWLYAKPTNVEGPGHLAYESMALGFCGDWLSGGRVEGAYVSVQSLLDRWQALGG